MAKDQNKPVDKSKEIKEKLYSLEEICVINKIGERTKISLIKMWGNKEKLSKDNWDIKLKEAKIIS